MRAEPVRYDPFSWEIHEDPYPIYHRLRDEAPLYRDEAGGFYALSRYADVHRTLHDHETFSSGRGFLLEDIDDFTLPMLLGMDPPDHGRLRATISRALTPRRVAVLEEPVRERCRALIDGFASVGQADLIGDFAARLPMWVISCLLGVPDADQDELRRLADVMVHREDGARGVPAAGKEAAARIYGYFESLLAARAAADGDDLLSLLVLAERAGEISHLEILECTSASAPRSPASRRGSRSRSCSRACRISPSTCPASCACIRGTCGGTPSCQSRSRGGSYSQLSPSRSRTLTLEIVDPPVVPIERAIRFLRGQRVLLDTDLAALYEVPVKRLNEQVKRNRERFPIDFMFELTVDEARSLRSQTATLERGRYRKYLPYAFTEQGVAMLSSVLRSARAVSMNIEIMRAFVRLRRMLQTNEDLARKLTTIEKRYDGQFRVVFDAIRELMAPPTSPRRPIGFRDHSGR